MAGSVFGNIFKISTWGESHGEGLGVVIDGCPACLHILSGVFEGKTTGTPISLAVYNKTQRSADYSEIANYYRPGHADYTFDEKFGFRDYRGGGRSSGRETIGRVAAGAIAMKILKELGINITAYAKEIGGIGIDYDKFDIAERE